MRPNFDPSLYRQLRREGRTATDAHRLAHHVSYTALNERTIRLDTPDAAAEGITLTATLTVDRAPNFADLGHFTSLWSPGVLKTRVKHSYHQLPFFEPANPIESMREGLREAGYARGPAYAQARAWARTAMLQARNDLMYDVEITAAKAGVTLASVTVGGVLPREDDDFCRSMLDAIDQGDLCDKVMKQARHTLAQLSTLPPARPAPSTTEMGVDLKESSKWVAATRNNWLVSEFLEWAREQQYVLCKLNPDDGHFYQVYASAETLLAAWLGIDLDLVERERRALLQAMRVKQGG